MSINIEKLSKEIREVGKTIKSTKLLFIWQFMLNGSFHKVEMFHSKISGKRKLAVDASIISKKKAYDSNFQHSFKIDKHYFTLIQMKSDVYDLRIDNKSFDNLISEEKAGLLKPKKKKSPPKPPKKQTEEEITQQSAYEYYYANRNKKEYKRDLSNSSNDRENDYTGFEFRGGKNNWDNYDSGKMNVKKKEEELFNFNDIQKQDTFERNQNILSNIDFFGKSDNDQQNTNMFDMFNNNNNNNSSNQNVNMNFNFPPPQNNNNNNQQFNVDFNQNHPMNNWNNMNQDMQNMNQDMQNMNYNMNNNFNQMQNNQIESNFNSMPLQQNSLQMNQFEMDMNKDSNQSDPTNLNTLPQNYPSFEKKMSYGLELQNNPLESNNQLNQNSQQDYLQMSHKMNQGISDLGFFDDDNDNDKGTFNPPIQKDNNQNDFNINYNPQIESNNNQNDFKNKIINSGLVDLNNLLSDSAPQHQTSTNYDYNQFFNTQDNKEINNTPFDF